MSDKKRIKKLQKRVKRVLEDSRNMKTTIIKLHAGMEAMNDRMVGLLEEIKMKEQDDQRAVMEETDEEDLSTGGDSLTCKEAENEEGFNLRDYIAEEEEPDGDYRIIRLIDDSNQKIALVEYNGQILVFGNGDQMFGTGEDETMFAEALIHVPMNVSAKRERILLIGAGGGITAREVLRYPEVMEITAIDLDPRMMELGKDLEALVKFNEGSLHHPKVRTVIEDGRTFIENQHEKWDVIIVDLAEPSGKCPELSRLFSWEFFRLLKERLEPGGVINVSCPTLAKIPDFFWSVQATLVAAGLHVLPYHFDAMVEYEDDFGYCLATDCLVSPDEITISIPTRHISPDRLQDMFHIPYNYSKRWSNYKIQTDNNRVLVEIVDEAWGDE